MRGRPGQAADEVEGLHALDAVQAIGLLHRLEIIRPIPGVGFTLWPKQGCLTISGGVTRGQRGPSSFLAGP